MDKTEHHKDLLALKIGESLKFGMWDIFRVPGGWIYACDGGEQGNMSVFVPNNATLILIKDSLSEIERLMHELRLY